MSPVLSFPNLQKKAVGSPFCTASEITCKQLLPIEQGRAISEEVRHLMPCQVFQSASRS